jgi:hypothetical protein
VDEGYEFDAADENCSLYNILVSTGDFHSGATWRSLDMTLEQNINGTCLDLSFPSTELR